MKKVIILNFVDSGLINVTTNTLDAPSAYKVYKFKREMNKRYKDINDERLSLISSVFGENYQNEITEFNRLLKIGDANFTEEESARFNDLKEKNIKSDKLINEMVNDDVELENLQAIPYEDWNALKKENEMKIPFAFEEALENILWLPLKENDF